MPKGKKRVRKSLQQLRWENEDLGWRGPNEKEMKHILKSPLYSEKTKDAIRAKLEKISSSQISEDITER